MFALMLDPWFKSLDIFKTFVGSANVIHMVAEYDTKSLMLLLVTVFLFINFDVNGTIERTIIDDEGKSIFGAVTSSEATLQGLLMNELSLFCHLSMKLEDVILLLTWWNTHEGISTLH
jgi:hypothetical protein